MINCCIRQYEEGYRYKTMDQPQFQLIYLLQGELLLSSPGQWLRLGQGFFGVFPKGSTFNLECSKDYRGLYIIFEEGESPLTIENTFGMEGDTAIKVVAELLRMELLKEVLSDSVVQSLCESFAELANRLLSQGESLALKQKDKNIHVQKAVLKMQNSLYSKLSAEALLKGIGIGYRQISRYFSDLKGESPKQFYMKMKMQEVCRLLLESSYSVTAIAHELGFASSQHLSSQFKLMFGVTPKNWQLSNFKSQNQI